MTPILSFAHEESRIDVDELQEIAAQRDTAVQLEQRRDSQGQFQSFNDLPAKVQDGK